MEEILIVMAVHDTDENERTEYTKRTLDSLLETVDFDKHCLVVVDNGSCNKTKIAYLDFKVKYLNKFRQVSHQRIIFNESNIGTAEAVNKGLQFRKPGQHCIKMDNDVIVHQSGWVDEMANAIRLEPKIGIVGLKRNDLEQYPDHPTDFYRSTLFMLNHKKGEPWVIIEETPDIMGTCVMLNSALLDRIGYLKQPGLYGFDDVDCSIRSRLAGFRNCFLPHIRIDHIDAGGTDYSTWKQKTAGDAGEEFQATIRGYKDGSIPLFYSPFPDNKPIF